MNIFTYLFQNRMRLQERLNRTQTSPCDTGEKKARIRRLRKVYCDCANTRWRNRRAPRCLSQRDLGEIEMAGRIHDEPSDVTAEKGEVQMEGPGHVAVSLTPEAAIVTADRLRRQAQLARGQVGEPAADVDHVEDLPPGTISL